MNLHSLMSSVGEKSRELLRQRKYDKVLQEWVTLRAPLDQFFDHVMVMVPDKEVCTNRLSLLFIFESLFKQIADFSLIQHRS